MNTNVRQIREFQAVRDAIDCTGLSPAPLFRRLNAEQRRGNRGLAVVNNALQLRRQFRDEFSTPPPEAA
ncbi:hypothetical protein [Stenotrophomonas tuberculopleuritidis]|uniref:hypothetical protein n=1 Tax=Stenotrophomonas tuberculopleuritidis TaxID=3055079 RepID=UPI0026E5738F|nr:hypothetical protein [Stenotrophomonas sp. 704A1]